MKFVKELLQAKGHEVWSVAPEAKVYDALRLMAEKNVGALVVLEAGQVAGIISERDYARKVILKDKASKDAPVRKIMTEKVVCVRPEMAIEACMMLMTDKHIRHLPVLEGDKLIGVISIGDVVKGIIAEQKYTIDPLRAFHDYDPL